VLLTARTQSFDNSLLYPSPRATAPVLTKCALHAEVFWTCTTHALSTEREEVMGLLLGDVLVRSLI